MMNKQKIEILDKMYLSFVDSNTLIDFISWLRQYIEYLKSDLSDVIKILWNEKKSEYSALRNYEKVTLKELDSSYKKLKNILKENNVEESSIPSLVELDNIKSGKIIVSWEWFSTYADSLFEICVELKEKWYWNIISCFEDKSWRIRNTRWEYSFSREYFNALKEYAKILKYEASKPWKSYELLEAYSKYDITPYNFSSKYTELNDDYVRDLKQLNNKILALSDVDEYDDTIADWLIEDEFVKKKFEKNNDILIWEYDKETNEIIRITKNDTYLHVSKWKLRREDIVMLWELIRKTWSVALKSTIKEVMWYHDNDDNDNILYRSAYRLRQHWWCDYIKMKRWIWYFLG